MNRLPLAIQMIIAMIVLALGGIWLFTPERWEAVTYSMRWYADLARGMQHAQDPVLELLPPRSSGASAPLVTFEETAFLGCDLDMWGAKLFLVTEWQGSLKDMNLEARLDFTLDGELLASDRWLLDSAEHRSEVPSSFFSTRGSHATRLMVVDGSLGGPVVPTASVLPVMGASVRICN